MHLENQHPNRAQRCDLIKNSFFIKKFGLVLKVCVEENKKVNVELFDCEARKTDFALRLAGIQKQFAEIVLARYKGIHHYAKLLIVFDEKRWQVLQADYVLVNHP